MTKLENPKVDIALAVYNGGKHLCDQLESYVSQSFEPLVLVASDDGSADDTEEILKCHSSRIPIVVTHNRMGRGVLRNFETALALCDADYVALSDQDDVWHTDKVRLLYDKVRELEDRHGKETPILAFSDLEIVASDLSVLASSFFSSSLKSPSTGPLREYVLDSHVPGCAMMVNRALLAAALPFPEVMIHDWWLMLVALRVGKVGYVDQALIKYRQHAQNSIGLGDVGRSRAMRFLKLLRRPVSFLAARRAAWRARAKAIRSNLLALKDRFGVDGMGGAEAETLVRGLCFRSDFLDRVRLFRGVRTGLRWFDLFGVLWLLGREP